MRSRSSPSPPMRHWPSTPSPRSVVELPPNRRSGNSVRIPTRSCPSSSRTADSAPTSPMARPTPPCARRTRSTRSLPSGRRSCWPRNAPRVPAPGAGRRSARRPRRGRPRPAPRRPAPARRRRARHLLRRNRPPAQPDPRRRRKPLPRAGRHLRQPPARPVSDRSSGSRE